MTHQRQHGDLPHRSHFWRRAVVLALLCVALAALASSDALHGVLIDLLSEIRLIIAAHPVLGAVIFILFAAVSAMFAFLSVAAVVPAAVYTWGVAFSILALWIGWILGGIGAYVIGRHLGRRVVVWLTSGEEVLHKLESRIRPDTPFGVVLLFQLALPSELPGYVLGLTRYSLPRYLLALAIAELPFTIATVVLGQSFVERRSWVILAVGGAIVAFSVTTFYALRKALAAHK